jgi:hypothetical protein
MAMNGSALKCDLSWSDTVLTGGHTHSNARLRAL